MSKHKILLVEDDELDVISVQRSLKKLETEFELHIACNGKEAIAMLKNEKSPLHPDVILLDLNMPKMNGLEFLKILRSDKDLKELQVFVLTTSNENRDRLVTEQFGISGFIIKPLNYDGNTKKADSMDGFLQFYLRKILTDKVG